MTHSMRPVRAALVAAALLTAAACSSTAGDASATDGSIILDHPGVGGLPEAQPPADPSSSDELLGTLDAGSLAGPDGHARAVTAGPGGSIVVLASDTQDAAGRTVLVEYLPGPDGLTVARTVEIPRVDGSSDLHVAPDGTVLVIGELRAGDGSTLLVRVVPGAG